MHEIEQVISQAKTLGKLEDQQQRREQILAITTVVALGFLGAAGVNGLTEQSIISLESLSQVSIPVIILGGGYGLYNLRKLFKIDTQIKSIRRNLTQNEDSIIYEKPKRQAFKLGDDGELIEVNDQISSTLSSKISS